MKTKRERRQSLDMAAKNWEKRFKRKRQAGNPSLWESVKEYEDQSQAWAKVTSLNYFVSSQDKSANLT